MKPFQNIVQWFFALFMAALTAVVCAIVFGLLPAFFFKVKGAGAGMPLPADFMSKQNLSILLILVHLSVDLPPMFAAFVGACTVPKAHRPVALFVFPILLFIGVSLLNAEALAGLNWKMEMEQGIGFALVAAGLYYKWKPRPQLSASKDIL